MNGPRSLRQVVGDRVRELRKSAGLRQEDIARAARDVGLAWPRQKIAELERGEKSISAEELILLPSVLSALLVDLDREVSLADLLDSDAEIRLSPKTRISARDVSRELCGEREPGAFVHVEVPDIDSLIAVQRTAGEAEHRIARKLDEQRNVIYAICHRLWGQSLSAERDSRVAAALPADTPPPTVQAKRGRVTRDLAEEIRTFIEAAERGIKNG